MEPDILDLPVIHDEAEQLYVRLADMGAMPGAPPANPITPASLNGSTRKAWQQLKELGLVDGSIDNPTVLDPSSLLRRARRDLQRRRLELEAEADRARAGLDRLSAAYARSNATSATGSTEFEVLEGAENITAAIDEASAECKQQMLHAMPGGGRAVPILEDTCRRDVNLLKRGVGIRALYQHPARFSAQTRLYIEQVESHGGEVRTLDEFFDQLIMVDHTVAFLPANEDVSEAVAVRQPAVLRFLASVFDRAWIRAIPFSKDVGRATLREAVDSTRLIVARLVITGDTDEVCARRAGLSLRNYREHVRQLMGQLSARSRSELGYRIAQVGLLENGRRCPSPEHAAAAG
jgi:sugar-specific transcriptional regulator TrmB